MRSTKRRSRSKKPTDSPSGTPRQAEDSGSSSLGFLAGGGERLAAMHANMPIGLTELALDGRWINVNDAFCRIVGYTRNELLKLRFFEITFEEDLPRNRELMSQLAAGEIPSFRLEKRFIRKDGSPVWVDVNRSQIGRAQV